MTMDDTYNHDKSLRMLPCTVKVIDGERQTERWAVRLSP